MEICLTATGNEWVGLIKVKLDREFSSEQLCLTWMEPCNAFLIDISPFDIFPTNTFLQNDVKQRNLEPNGQRISAK